VISDQIKIIFSKNDFKSDQDHIKIKDHFLGAPLAPALTPHFECFLADFSISSSEGVCKILTSSAPYNTMFQRKVCFCLSEKCVSLNVLGRGANSQPLPLEELDTSTDALTHWAVRTLKEL
jgi:hypothetical protein